MKALMSHHVRRAAECRLSSRIGEFGFTGVLRNNDISRGCPLECHVSTKILVSNDCFPQLQYDGFPLVARYRSAVARCGSGWNTKGNTGYIIVNKQDGRKWDGRRHACRDERRNERCTWIIPDSWNDMARTYKHRMR